jgi:hypothetical protein
MTSPPIISYATDPGDQLSIVQLEDGGVEIHVPPQGWLWFTRGRRSPLVAISLIGIIFVGVWIVLFRAWLSGDRDVIVALPVAIAQAAFVAYTVLQVRASGLKRVRITATRQGLWIRTTGTTASPLERFFPIEWIGDVDVKWLRARGGRRGAMTVTLRGGGQEMFLDHCRGKDIVQVVNAVRRAIGLWPRSYTVPKGA